MIKLQHICKQYQVGDTATPILKDINITINKGEFVAIMGPSGSGKSTLMNIIGMLDTPTSGTYHFNQREVSTLSDDELADIRLKNIGFVFQSFNLLKRTTVLRNVMLPFIYTVHPKNKIERETKAKQALKLVGLDQEKIWSHLSNQLSGGQMQRVAIARALINNPELILADEPTGNLDTKTGEIVLATFTKLNQEQERSIVMITHEPDVAQFAQRVIVIRDGEIIKDYHNKH
ncbi:MAG: ABC transporter ATP-binding protein [Patescibacteria group bacterium]|jgi:putative ABC transport system ATP-binding protein